ncbi:MAG: hypothetical protein EXQ89_00815 [Rhodospirillaceae bacterium]|nr:hypothetical protein [Rhodospirillaceae bacterium]
MIPRSGLMWLGLALAIGGGLFDIKHDVQSFEDELNRLNRAMTAEQQAIHVLKAEWSLINQPSRLQGLAARHLDLIAMDPRQIVHVADLPFPGEVLPAPPPPAKRPTAAPRPASPPVARAPAKPAIVAESKAGEPKPTLPPGGRGQAESAAEAPPPSQPPKIAALAEAGGPE